MNLQLKQLIYDYDICDEQVLIEIKLGNVIGISRNKII